jgi:hypothetical protein
MGWNSFVMKTRVVTIPLAILLGLVSIYYSYAVWDCNAISASLLGLFGTLCLLKALLLAKGA